MATDYPLSTPSWAYLARLRRRGQRPVEMLLLTDHEQQRRNLVNSGAFALPMPSTEEDYLVAGLDIALIADFTKAFWADVVRRLANANPRTFRIYWRGRAALVDVPGWGNTYPPFPS